MVTERRKYTPPSIAHTEEIATYGEEGPKEDAPLWKTGKGPTKEGGTEKFKEQMGNYVRKEKKRVKRSPRVFFQQFSALLQMLRRGDQEYGGKDD